MANNHWREPCEHCGKRTACPHYPAYVDGFPARVRLAAQCIRTRAGIGSRAFDNCFEMSDGAAVVMALEYMARRDPALRAGIDREWNNAEAHAHWQKTIDAHADIPEASLSGFAARLRARAAAEMAAWHPDGPTQLALL